MSAIIFGVGVGLVILISIWLVAIFICLVSFRTRRNVGSITIGIAFLFSLILLLIPLDSNTPSPKVYRIYDNIFVWRTSLLILLLISSAVGFISYLVTHLMEPKVAQPIKEKRN